MLCDFPNCSNESATQILRLACFHTCHLDCLERNGNSCPICKDPFLTKINDLTDSFKRGLLENNDSTLPDINESHNMQSASSPGIATTRNADFYKSHDWENIISRTFEQIVVPQPSVPHTATQESRQTARSTSTSNAARRNHCSHCGQPGHCRSRGSRITCPILLQSHNLSSQQKTQSSTQPPPNNSHMPVPSQAFTLHVPPSTTDMVTFWDLPVFLSQSTIGGRNGSNACTVISLLLAKTFLTNKRFNTTNKHQPITHTKLDCGLYLLHAWRESGI